MKAATLRTASSAPPPILVPTTVEPPAVSTAPTVSETPTITLAEQRSPDGANGVFQLLVAVTGLEGVRNPTTFEAAATLFQRITTRAQLKAAIAGTGLTSVRSFVSQPLPPRDSWVLNANYSAGRLLLGLDLRAGIGAEGTYPIRVELRTTGGNEVLHAFTTFATTSQQLVTKPLDVAVVLPFEQAPSTPQGRTLPTLASPLATIADRLLAHPDRPVTLWPTPQAFDNLVQTDQSLVTLVRDVLTGREVLSAPYVSIDPALIENTSLRSELRRTAAEGQAAIVRNLGAVPSTGTYVVRAGDPVPSRLVLEALGVNRLIVPEDSLTRRAVSPVHTVTTYDPGAAESVETPALPLLVLDPALTDHLQPQATPGLGVLQVEHLLADLALIHQSAPTRSGAVALVVPASFITSDTLDALLVGLAADNRLRLVTVTEAFAHEPAIDRNGNLIVRRAQRDSTSGSATAATNEPAINLSTLNLVRLRSDGLMSMMTTPSESVDALGRKLFLVLARNLSVADRNAALYEVQQQVDRELGRMYLGPEDSFFLTARRGRIPISFVSEFEESVQIQVSVQSDRVEIADPLVFQLELGQGTTTQFFGVETREPGRFPIRVTVTAPDGLVLYEKSYLLRSSTASWVGTALTIGALMVLVLWWCLSIVRSRREKTHRRHPATRADVA